MDNIYEEQNSNNAELDTVDQQMNLDSEKVFRRYLETQLLNHLFTGFNQKINKDSPIIKLLIRNLLNKDHSLDSFINLFHRQEQVIRSRSLEVLKNKISDEELSEVYRTSIDLISDSNISKEIIISEQRKLEQEILENQLDDKEYRTHEKLKEGIPISINGSHFVIFKEKVKQSIDEHPEIPLLEQLKNEKILALSGFKESKVSLAVHDFYDHVLFTDILLEHRVIDSYKDLLQDIGDPLNTDILSRVGERIASMAYQARKLLLIDLDSYVPKIEANTKNIERLKKILSEGSVEFPDDNTRFVKAEELLDNPNFNFKILEFLLNEVLSEFMKENKAKRPLKYTRGEKFASVSEIYSEKFGIDPSIMLLEKILTFDKKPDWVK